MSLVFSMIAPLALVVPAANAAAVPLGAMEKSVIPMVQSEEVISQLIAPKDTSLPSFDPAELLVFSMMAGAFNPQVQNQVRIEQQITIRITPRQQGTTQPNMLAALPDRPLPVRLIERDMGKCLPISGVAGVQPAADNKLILYMRDTRVVSAALDKMCSARDFYSGFYVQRSSDGQICVKRDTLLSRSGANCKLSKIKQLVEAGN